MNSRRLITLISALFVLLLSSYCWIKISNNVVETAVLPETASIELERTGATSNKTTDELILFWQNRVQNSPTDYISLTHLGNTYINKARESADLSNYDKAEESLQAALKINPTYLAAIAYLSAVRFAQHDFNSALHLAEEVYEADPSALLALALIGDAQVELGQYYDATITYQQLSNVNDSPPVLSRLARLAWLNGEVETAVSYLKEAEDASKEQGQSGEKLAWYQFQLGELYFHMGDLESASAQYQAALESYPSYYLGFLGQADVAIAKDNLELAIGLYEQIVLSTPQPTYLATLGDLYEANGDQILANEQFERIERLAANGAYENKMLSHQFAEFYLGHNTQLEEALLIAEAELANREDIFSYELYAWALYKNGRFAEAADAINEALRLNTQDAHLYYFAGLIYDAQNQKTAATEMFTKALEINPYFDAAGAIEAQDKLASY